MDSSCQPGCFPENETAFPGPYSDDFPPLPLGEWHLLVNGRILTLDVTNVTGNLVDVVLSSGDIEDVLWEQTIGKLTFTRVLPDLRQDFTGYLLHYDKNDPKWRMAGTFESQKRFPTSGWYATLPR